MDDVFKVIPMNFQSLLCLCAPSPLTDACRPVLGLDALMNRRTLFERSELGRPPQARVRPTLNETGRGVTGFGSFCRNKRTSAAGPKPGKYKEF